MELARRLEAEIVGADSRQIYRGLEIGTEAPTVEDRARVPHHFVAFLDPSETYSAGRYGKEARAAVRAIEARGKMAIVAGGSGLYIRALLQGLFHGPARDEAIRARLTRRIRDEGLEALRVELRRVDPEALASILPGDPVRVIRRRRAPGRVTLRPALVARGFGRANLLANRAPAPARVPRRDEGAPCGSASGGRTGASYARIPGAPGAPPGRVHAGRGQGPDRTQDAAAREAPGDLVSTHAGRPLGRASERGRSRARGRCDPRSP